MPDSGSQYVTLTRERCIAQMPFLLTVTADQIDWPPWTEAQFLYELADKWSLSFSNDIGMATLSSRSPEQVHMHLLGIVPERRGMGNGTKFMREMIARVAGRRFTLKVPSDSERAVRFYLRHQFAFTDRPADSRWWPMERPRGLPYTPP